MALTIFPCYTWLAYFTYQLRSELTQKRKTQVSDILSKKESGWAYELSISATKYIGVGFFIMGKCVKQNLKKTDLVFF